MADDTAKDTLVGAATVGATALAAVSTGVGLVAAAVPGLIAVTVDAWKRHQERRVAKWWTKLIEGADSPSELKAKLERGLEDHREDVVQGVVGGARAAADTINDTSVAAIAALSRMYFAGEVKPWLYRAALDLFTTASAHELMNLRILSEQVALCTVRFVRLQALPFDEQCASEVMALHARPDETYAVGARSSEGDFVPVRDDLEVRNKHVVLTTISDAPRVFQLLRRAALLEDGPSGGFGAATARNLAIMDRSVARVFAKALQGL